MRIRKYSPSLRSIFIASLQVLLLSSVFFALAMSVVKNRFGSVLAARAYIAGVRVWTDSPLIIGNFDPNHKEATFTFVLRNLDHVDIPIIGTMTSCNCTVTDQLPPLIPAGGQSEVIARVSIDPKRIGEDLRGEIHVFTGHESQTEIVLSYLLTTKSDQSGMISDRVGTSL